MKQNHWIRSVSAAWELEKLCLLTIDQKWEGEHRVEGLEDEKNFRDTAKEKGAGLASVQAVTIPLLMGTRELC